MNSDPQNARVFRFRGCAYDSDTGEARLAWQVDDGPELVERIVFPGAPRPRGEAAERALAAALGLLHWIAGVSYWKAGLAPEMRFESAAPSLAVRDFLSELYVNGLAEFAFVNDVDVAGRLHWPAPADPAADTVPPASSAGLGEGALVAMGGGKDSLVALELARAAGLEVRPWCVGQSPLIAETVAAAGFELLQVRRRLAPELVRMNEAGAWNGHVPVTAINSAIGVCAALLYGCRYVVFANERSADEATVTGVDGRPVNHQWSKSSAFEAAFRSVVAGTVASDLAYFSMLRPYSELDIVRRFARLDRYHRLYSSCNRNFQLAGPAISGRWCGDCPKCRFAALSLAVFLPPARVQAILGSDLLDDPAQAAGFRALCALGADKPFECVGETGECRAALAALAASDSWCDHAVVRMLSPELREVDVPGMETLLRPSAAHFIPAEIAGRLPGGGP